MAATPFIGIDEGVYTPVYRLLKSYGSAGLIDGADFSFRTIKALTELGRLVTTRPAEIWLLLQDHQAQLPDDVASLTEVWLDDKPLYPHPHSQYGCGSYILTDTRLHCPERASGNLYIKYASTDILSQVPNDPILLDYLQKNLVYHTLNDWYLNGTVANLENILSRAGVQYKAAFDLALYTEKLPTYNQLRQHRKTRFPRSTWR